MEEIRADMMLVFNALWHRDMRNLHDLNEALLILLPKLADTFMVRDYRPITLIHTIGKLISKVLTFRLVLRLHELIQSNQSAFIKGRFIQDNFKMVQCTSTPFPSLLLKIDIARAFDSVAWPFLLELLKHMGFPLVGREWVAALLSSASTKILLNGNLGGRIYHMKELRQRDPLSPFLFLLVMEVLDTLMRKAESWSLFRPLGLSSSAFRASFYVKDLVWFLSPD
jgi:hypothetical protein